MGQADNKSYKDQYHFTDDRKNTAKENPSIEADPKINTTIKENPYRSNVEIEGDEIILKPDLTALFKASGKKHSSGGMDVLLEPNSFVFSAFKDLTISPKEHELFELKEGGTPAKTLKKNIDLKHYNTLVEILDNPYKDDLAKKSATKMLEKYISTLGNIAYIQEKKKGFPEGLPEFAMGTAPIYDDTLKNTIDANKQYRKAGGRIMALGGDAECPCGRFPNGMCKPCPKDDETKWNPYIQGAEISTSIPANSFNVFNNDKGSLYQDYTAGSKPKPTKEQEAAYMRWLNTKSSEEKQRIINANIEAGKKLKSTQESDSFKWINKNTPDISKPNPSYYQDKTGNHYFIPRELGAEDPKIEDNKPQVEDINITPQGSKVADWKFTPWQKASQLYNWGQYANVKKYMPYRSRFDATYMDPALVNPEQVVGDIKGMANQQLASLNTLNPILRNAQASSAFGQVLNQIPGVRSQYDNQNAQILNQTRQYNNQVKNQETQTNMINDQKYYQESIEGRKNYDNMKQFTANNAFNNTLRDVETNQKLAYNLLTQNDPAYNFDWNTGKFNRTNKSIMDARIGDTRGQYLEEYFSKQLKDWDKMDATQRNNLLKIMVAKGFTPTQGGVGNIFEKKGGYVRKNPYKK